MTRETHWYALFCQFFLCSLISSVHCQKWWSHLREETFECIFVATESLKLLKFVAKYRCTV